jgi:hypothetical protein
VGQRIFGLALGYEDLVDHDELRKDPTLAVLAGKLEPVLRSDCEALAGKSTLNRLEHTPKRHGAKYHKIDCDGAKVDALLVDLFIEAHERAPREIVIDLDNTDIPLYGMQEGRFFHGYYDDYCYLPLYAFCGRHLLLARQRRANVAGSAGAVEEVARIVARIRRKWRKVRIVLRADSGFANEELMALVRGEPRRLRVRPGTQLPPGGSAGCRIGRGQAPASCVRCTGPGVPRFPLSNARQLEPEAAGRRQGRA